MSEQTPEPSLPPSKSQLKRDAQALTKLGEQLVSLDEKQLSQFNLPDNIRDAIVTTRKIRQHGARKRQLLFLAKLLRKANSSEIILQMATLNTQTKQQARAFHQLEQWRDKLLADDQALTDLLNEHPNIDAQHIRQLIRAARKDQQLNKPPASARSLFRYLRSIILDD